MLRRHIIAILLATLMLIGMSAVVYAGDYHYGQTLNCSDCHSMHASARHDTSGNPVNVEITNSSHLIRSTSATQICLQCHDNRVGVPDVLGIDINNPSEQYDGAERAGGMFSQETADNWKGHNLPGQGSPGPGDCTMCHDPHGNANYRNLKTRDESFASPLAFVNPSSAGLERYRRSNIGYGRNMGDQLCGRCHDVGTPANTIASGGGHYVRHPSTGSDMVFTLEGEGKHVDAANWASGTGSGFLVAGNSVPRLPFAVGSATDFASATTVAASNEVFCLSCHKAHGSVHAFGMTWPYGTGPGQLSSSGCNQCHNTSGI